MLQPQVLALDKFSFATCPGDANGPINWTHVLDRDKLHAVFDLVRIQRSSGEVMERTVLKVVRGLEILVRPYTLYQEAKTRDLTI
jgi:hypothetical protein